MTKLVLSILAVLILAACTNGTITTTATKTVPPSLGPPSGEAKHDHAASGCGVERWAVKTGTDPGAHAVVLTPRDTTIQALRAFPAPSNPSDRVAPVETTTWHLTGTITAVKQEADSDYHLVVVDTQGYSMIVEAASPNCDNGSLFAGQISQVRNDLNQACPNIGSTYRQVSVPADLTGVGFYDKLHGQRGLAPNGIELHPILAITLRGRC